VSTIDSCGTGPATGALRGEFAAASGWRGYFWVHC
jgi:hypothetical protein